MRPNNFDVMYSLGIGGTAEVFAARNTEHDRVVALKCFAQHLVRDEEAIHRLRNEVDALRKLTHPNVVGLYAVYEKSDEYFALELELVAGKHLGEWAKGYDISLIEPKLWLLSQIARGIGAAHEQGILHRDLKPENILVSNQGEVKITDFGLARLLTKLTVTRLGLLVGSLGYMAPEIINGERATVHSDIFSFGVLAYELLGERAPFQGETPQELIKKIVDGDFVPLQEEAPAVPHEVADLINRSLSVDKTKRPQGIWDFEAALLATIQKTGLMPYCSQLVGEETRSDELLEALDIRHKTLKTELDEGVKKIEQKSTSQIDRRSFVYASAELRRLYPDDKSIENYISAYAGKTGSESDKRKFLYLAIVLLLLFIPGIYLAIDSTDQATKKAPTGSGAEVAIIADPKSDSEKEEASNEEESVANRSSRAADMVKSRAAAVSRPEEALSPEPKASKRRTSARPAKRARTEARNRVLHGWVQFEVEEDVNVFVDGKLVPRAQLGHYQLTEGIHDVKLVKQGYMPIANTVKIRAGQITVVRAKPN